MTNSPSVVIANRTPGSVFGMTTVHAYVYGGETGEYLIKNHIVGTQSEVDEILAQSAARQETRLAAKAGTD